MRIAIAHNLRAGNDVAETVFASQQTVDSLVDAIHALGHEAVALEVSGPVGGILEKLEKTDPDLLFNIAEGWADSARQSFYTSLFARLGFPCTGSGPDVQAVLRDKRLTKLVAGERGIRTPRWSFAREKHQLDLDRLRFPVIVKPNSEGTSQGITQESVVDTPAEALARAEGLFAEYPAGILVEEFIPGRELTVPYLAAVDNEFGGVLDPTEIVLADVPGSGRRHRILDYAFKNYQHRPLTAPAPQAAYETPARLPGEMLRRARETTAAVVRALGCQDIARVDFRLGEDGELYFLEANALPGLDPGLSIHEAARLAGLHPEHGVVEAVIRSATARYGLEA